MRPKPKTGPKLPDALVEQLGEQPPAGKAGRTRKSKPKLSRKESRKQDRYEKKQRKATFFGAGSKRAAEQDHPESPQRKKARFASSNESATPAAPNAKLSKPSRALSKESKRLPDDKPKKSKSALQKLVDGGVPASAPRTQKEEDGDAYIEYLEKRLGMGKGKKQSKKGASFGGEFDDDGLDDLLTGLDSILVPSSIETAHASDSEEESDGDEGEDEDEGGGEDEENEDDLRSKSVDDDEADVEEWTGFQQSEDDVPIPEDAGQLEDKLLPAKDATPGSRYVPPHLRNRSETGESEALTKLSRQLKGLLNRLSEQNISNIIEEIEELYRKHRRHDVTENLTSLIIQGISSHSSLLDSYVVLHAALISSLHKILGVEFAASFVQSVVTSYEKHYSHITSSADSPDEVVDDDIRGKECSNLIILLSELYNFQVISCVLVYDVIRTLLNADLTELNVELLLKLLRISGQQLRQDDPSALKDIVQIIQTKTSENEGSSSSRTRFMVETLINLKNNKMKRTATQHAGSDSVDRLKKFLVGLDKKRHVMAHDPLRVTLDDLHSAESRGKWWLVGAAWGGDPLVERQEQREAASAQTQGTSSENMLLKLAKKQGMNTDIRRSIFVVLMSSDDYVDACEQLAQLNLTEVQQREIIRVMLHCCGNEKAYNPYYTFVGQHLCRISHSYKVTLQFCLWDFLRDLGEMTVGGAEIIKNLKDDFDFDNTKTVSSSRRRNIAKAYGWWVARDCVSLAILKPVDFVRAKPQTRKFLGEFLEQVFINSQTPTPVLSSKIGDLPTTRNKGALEAIFVKATRAEALAMGLVYFFLETFQARKAEDDEAKFFAWASSVAKQTLRTGIDIVPTL